MRYRHQSGSGGRTFRLYLERRETVGHGRALRRSPALGLAGDLETGSLHLLRDDMGRPERLPLAEVVSETPPAAGFVEIDGRSLPGLYALTLPAGAFAAGSASVVFALSFPGVDSTLLEVELVAFDPYDGVGIGLDGFTKSVRHQNLTSILVHLMPDSVRALAHESARHQQRRTR